MRKFFLMAFVFTSMVLFSQERRLALVIGNSAYEHGGILRNPVNDAYSMDQALTDVGFQVMVYFNLNQAQMKQAIDEFGRNLSDYDVGLFFYAGHGIQTNGENYLIPVDANLESEEQIEYDCVNASRVLARLDASGADIKLVVLDACRNNPFERSWTRSSSGRGLAFMNAPKGTLIAYATSPGSTASDGEGQNGLYTRAILESMGIPDITVLQLFQNVRSIVTEISGNRQIPWESTSLVGDFYLGSRETVHTDVPGKTVTADAFSSSSSGVFKDDRDGEQYNWIRIGDQVWMAENLNHNSGIGCYIYNNEESNAETYGRLYNWETARIVCPAGWHLPHDNEWKELEVYLGMSNSVTNGTDYRGSSEGSKLKSQSGWESQGHGSNESGFSALPGGFRSDYNGYNFSGKSAYFWSSGEADEEGYAWTRMLFYGKTESARIFSNKLNGLSVRCIRD